MTRSEQLENRARILAKAVCHPPRLSKRTQQRLLTDPVFAARYFAKREKRQIAFEKAMDAYCAATGLSWR